jgi:orotidine-5'-phosphate decarboxylase
MFRLRAYGPIEKDLHDGNFYICRQPCLAMNNLDRLIVALDVPTIEDARALVKKIGDAARFYKIGLELLYSGGIKLAEELIARGYDVFIDAKLHDIPNTVERATRQISALGASLLTVHAYPQTMQAALLGRSSSNLKIIGVTILTSMTESDAKAAGYEKPIAELVDLRAKAARDIGIDGIVCSPREAKTARHILGPKALIVTPGIRMAGEDTGDQSRVETPASALKNGASHIVVGRPITRASDPRAAAQSIVADMALGLAA